MTEPADVVTYVAGLEGRREVASEYVRGIWGEDAVECHDEEHEQRPVWHHRDYHLPSDIHLSLRLRLRWALEAFWRELRSHA